MRYKIAKMGALPIEGIFLCDDSLRVEDDRIPVTSEFDRAELLGWAKDFKIEDGFLTAEVNWFDGFSDDTFKSMGATFIATDVVWHMFRGVQFVEDCRVREVAFSLAVPWAEGYRG